MNFRVHYTSKAKKVFGKSKPQRLILHFMGLGAL